MKARPKGGIVLRECDAREIASIFGEIAVLDVGLVEKRDFLLTRVSDALSADQWFYGLGVENGDGELELTKTLHGTGVPQSSEKEVADQIPDIGDCRGTLATSPQESGVATEANASRSPYLSIVTPVGEEASWAVMLRNTDRPKFSQRELKFASTVLGGAPWLHHSALTTVVPMRHGEEAGALPPRLAEVLQHLLEGRARKEIADLLGISLHTVHGYARDLYSRFDVHSQAELICKLTQRERVAA